jgi:2-polyprenyl-3-methyl-5-hydroxy-6-metoxy-1,4-benzoquinol methylase
MYTPNPVSLDSEKPSFPQLNDLAVLREVAKRYPADLVDGQLMDVDRIHFNIGLAFGAMPHMARDHLSICDLGGGIGLFSVGCAALGVKRSVLIDDFNDTVNHRVGPAVLDLHRSFGVEVHSRDVVSAGIADLDGLFDVISSFESMEHWHNSPKKLFGEVMRKLKPGGAFVLGVPNCVNIRKRVSGLLGRNKWSSMAEWYEKPQFRGHVREPDVDDLYYIARSMGLEKPRIYGRNWLGYFSSNPIVRLVTRIADYPLRLRPQLCSDIALVAFRPR